MILHGCIKQNVDGIVQCVLQALTPKILYLYKTLCSMPRITSKSYGDCRKSKGNKLGYWYA